MDLKKILKFDSKNFDFKKIASSIGLFWIKHSKVIFISLVIFSALSGVYVWYNSLYKIEWTQAEKDNYNLSQNRETNLKEDLFREVVNSLNEKEEKLKSEPREIKDIFKTY